MSNLKRLQDQLVEKNLPAMLVSDATNVGWLTGFTGSFGWAVVTPTDGVFITDSRYTIQAGEQVQDLPVLSYATPKKATDVLKESAEKLGVSELGFEVGTSFQTYSDWTEALSPIRLTPAKGVVEPLRMIKTPDEIAKIRAACKLADACFDHVRRLIQPGVSELDIAIEIEFFFRRSGASAAFDVIAVGGPNSARPHGVPSERKLQPGDFLTLDFGAKLDGYNSDMTRTVVIGEASDRHRQIYDRVLEAEVAAIEAIRPGANGKDLDILAREILDKDDLSQYFGHSLGHGLGRAVHDPGRLSQTADEPIRPGQVWTVEPGVYIEGFGGVRIEDDVLVTEDGFEILTSAPKELLVLP